jgi:hypothetical protein
MENMHKELYGGSGLKLSCPVRIPPSMTGSVIFLEASVYRHHQLLTQSPTPLLFLGQSGAESYKLLIMVWSFW